MEGYTKEEFQLATEILGKFVPNRYPPHNNWVKAMMEYGREYHEQQVKNCDLADVGGNEVALCKHEYLIRDQDWMTCNYCGDVKPVRQ